MQLRDLPTSKRLRLIKELNERWQAHLIQFADRGWIATRPV